VAGEQGEHLGHERADAAEANVGADSGGEAVTTPVSWPQAREYRDAVQAPKVCFSSSKLKSAVIHPDLMGMPLAAAGKSAIVFKATAGGKDVAIRCFTRASSSQQRRYQELQKHLKSTFPSYMVKFRYRDQEILVAGTRHPLVEMDWVDGNPLDAWVAKHLHDGNLASQAESWLAITGDMQRRGLAHGDIANDNCMVSGSQLKLVDYDGCYVPGLARQNPGEAGAQHFQHPGRKGYYAANMDAFPSLVIYLSLLALHADPSLWRFHRDKNLIFQAADYRAPRTTPVWQELARSPDEKVVSLADTLAAMCRNGIGDLELLPDVVTPWWKNPALHLTEKINVVPPPDARPVTGERSIEWLLDHLPSNGKPQTQPPRTEPAQSEPAQVIQPAIRKPAPLEAVRAGSAQPEATRQASLPHRAAPPPPTPAKRRTTPAKVLLTVLVAVLILAVLYGISTAL
jgi:hypothetical protein